MGEIQAPQYYSPYIAGNVAYVKLALFADNALYRMYNNNATKALEVLRDVVKYTARVYLPLNAHIFLTYAEVWVDGDPVAITSNSVKSVYEIQRFATRFMKLFPCDHVGVISGVHFTDQAFVGGRAQLDQICRESGTSVITGEFDIIDVTATMFAHELGHSLGVQHDEEYPVCQCPFREGCIMGAKTSRSSGKKYWSTCSLARLQQTFSTHPKYRCLKQRPAAIDNTFRCGNGVIETGEQCDCGSTLSCRNGCCDPGSCRVRRGAQCGGGGCCDLKTCRLHVASTLCRQAKDICDLPEFCDGRSNQCPADFYMQNGTPCSRYSKNFCYEGVCGDRDNACKTFWGNQAYRSDRCLTVNLQTTESTNCGYYGPSSIKSCNQNSYTCGRLFCVPNKHVEQGIGSLRLLYVRGESCVGLSPFKVSPRDKGLVPSGATCGENALCVFGDCVSLKAVQNANPRCNPPNCNNLGYCNNVGNCHCKTGYGGTGCSRRGPGGSVNSGPSSLQNYDPRQTVQATPTRPSTKSALYTQQHIPVQSFQPTMYTVKYPTSSYYLQSNRYRGYNSGYQKLRYQDRRQYQQNGGHSDAQNSYSSAYNEYYKQYYKYYSQYGQYNPYQNSYTVKTMQTINMNTVAPDETGYSDIYHSTHFPKFKSKSSGRKSHNKVTIGPNEITILAGLCFISLALFVIFKAKSRNKKFFRLEETYYPEDKVDYDAPENVGLYWNTYEEPSGKRYRNGDYKGQKTFYSIERAYRAQRPANAYSSEPIYDQASFY